MPNHTPTPWRLKRRGNIANCIEARTDQQLFDGDDGWRTVASYQSTHTYGKWQDEEEEARANGELIINAVNTHGELLEMVEILTRDLPDLPDLIPQNLRRRAVRLVVLATDAKQKLE